MKKKKEANYAPSPPFYFKGKVAQRMFSKLCTKRKLDGRKSQVNDFFHDLIVKYGNKDVKLELSLMTLGSIELTRCW